MIHPPNQFTIARIAEYAALERDWEKISSIVKYGPRQVLLTLDMQCVYVHVLARFASLH